MRYFNEHDPFAAAWLRELYPDAVVDERSIADIRGADLDGHDRVHLFAGIAGWEYALELAGWSDGPVWTGSAPCQPFSVAGRGRGTADERHLWPEMRRLIAECRPPVVFGEQVGSRAGREWLAGVRLDLEALGYAVGAADLCAASIGAPHIRQRLVWVAYRDGEGRGERGERHGESKAGESASRGDDACRCGEVGGVADADQGQRGRQSDRQGRERDGQATGRVEGDCIAQSGVAACGLGESVEPRLEGHAGDGDRGHEPGRVVTQPGGPTPTAGPWDDSELIQCADGKARRIPKCSIQPLVDGLPKGVVRGGDPGAPIDANATAEARVMRLRGYGNSIVPQLAAVFIRAFLDVEAA